MLANYVSKYRPLNFLSSYKLSSITGPRMMIFAWYINMTDSPESLFRPPGFRVTSSGPSVAIEIVNIEWVCPTVEYYQVLVALQECGSSMLLTSHMEPLPGQDVAIKRSRIWECISSGAETTYHPLRGTPLTLSFSSACRHLKSITKIRKRRMHHSAMYLNDLASDELCSLCAIFR